MQRRHFLANSALLGFAPLARVFDVTSTGAIPDGKTLCTRQLQAAIDQAFAAGGGVAYVPPGRYLTGGLQIKSRVTLYLEGGAVILGSKNFDDYVVHPGPSLTGDANARHLVFAYNADDIGLCGPGTVDGQGQSYWQKNDHKPPAPGDEYLDSSAFYWKPTDRRPSPMVEFAMCRNVHVRDITLTNSPSWTFRPIACDSVFIDGLRIKNPNYGPNTDGLDITASSNVFVSNCDIDTGDDAICIKSENPYGAGLPTKNITITNCRLRTCCNGLKFGTATHGAYENITFTNSVIDSGGEPIMNRVIGGINLEMVDGGSIDGIVCSNIQMRDTRTPIFIRLGNRTPSKDTTFVRNILIQGIQATGAIITSSVTGLEDLRVSDVTLADIRIRTSEGGASSLRSVSVGERPKQYPESRMFGKLPAYGLYVRHADKIRLRNVEFITDQPDGRPAIVLDDSEDVVISGLLASAPVGNAPVIDMRNVRGAFVQGCRAPIGVSALVEVTGTRSKDIGVLNNQVSGSTKPVSYSGGAQAAANTGA